MQRLKERLFRDVTAVLEPSRLHPAAAGRWQEAWHRAARFLNRRPGHSEAHKQELQNKLYELHAAISSSIEAEVSFLLLPCAVTLKYCLSSTANSTVKDTSRTAEQAARAACGHQLPD